MGSIFSSLLSRTRPMLVPSKMSLRVLSVIGRQRRGLVERRDHLNLRWSRPGKSWQRVMGLQDQLTGLAEISSQVVVQHGRDLATAKQGGVVAVEVVGDEWCRCSTHLPEGVEDGGVAAADGVDGSDVVVIMEGSCDGGEHRGVEAVGLGDISDGSVGGQGPHGGAESHLAFFLTPETAAAQGDEDRGGGIVQHASDEVGGGGSGGAVVDADVADPSAEGEVSHEGDCRDALVVETID